MKTEGQVVYDNLKSVRRLLNVPFEKSMNKYKEFANVNISFVEINRIDDALRLLKIQNPMPVIKHDNDGLIYGRCPQCGKMMDKQRYCGNCGQAVIHVSKYGQKVDQDYGHPEYVDRR